MSSYNMTTMGGGRNDTTDRGEGSSAAVDVPGPSTSASNSNKRKLPYDRGTDSNINYKQNQSSLERKRTRRGMGCGRNDDADQGEGSPADDVPGPSTSAGNSNKRKGPHNRDTDSSRNHEQNQPSSKSRETRKQSSLESGESIGDYDQGGLTDTFHGTLYQLNHYILIVLRALESEYSFKLAKEMTAAGKFDDLVLKYKSRDSTEPLYRFVQFKHQARETEKSKITDKDLTNENDGDFSLLKYFKSYLEIEKSTEFSEDSLKEYILCTNRDMDDVKAMSDAKINFELVTKNDDFFKITDTPDERVPRRYKLNMEKTSKLYELMTSTSDMHLLAKVLAEHVCGNKKFTRKPDIFHKYDKFLTREVINMKSKKFRNNFIDPAERDNLTDKVKIFRDIFWSQVKKSKQYKDSKNKDKFLRKLQNSKYEFSEPFGAGLATELPDNEISKENISNFFERFVIAVDQPDEQQVIEALSKEMADRFKLNVKFIMNYFQIAIQNWFKRAGKRGYFLTEIDAKEILEGISAEISTLGIAGLSSDYKEELNDYNIEFESVDDKVKSFLSANSESEKLLKLFSSTDTLLLALRVQHTIKTVGGYENNDSCMWIKMEQLEGSNIRCSVIQAFQRPDHRCLLVVNCGPDGKKELALSLPALLIKSDISGNKKLILLSQGTGDTTDDTISFKDLTSKSRRIVLEKPIKFERSDKSTSLSRLLEIQNPDNLDNKDLNDVSKIMTSDSLVQLIRAKKDKPVMVGSIDNEWDTVKDHYIPRTLCRYETIDSAVFLDLEIEDCFATTGIGEDELRGYLLQTHRNEVATGSTVFRNCILLEDQQPEHHFEKHCAENEVSNIHWLHYNSGKFMWRKTHGDIGKLEKHRSRSDLTDLKEEELRNLRPEDRRTVIIGDTAGMGKSTILTHLAGKIKEKGDPSVFLVRINLRHFLDALAKQHESPSGSLQFLVEKLSGLNEDFEKRVLETMIKRDNNVVVMFDGLDEIESEYQELVIELLKKLRVRKLLVTTRPEMIGDLERGLNTYSYQLKPFVRQDQINFLCEFWNSKSVTEGRNRTSLELSDQADNVINQLEKSFINRMERFLGVPLQTRLVAEVLEDDTVIGAKINDVTALFESFMNKKWKILVDEKIGCDGRKRGRVDKYRNKLLFDDFRRVHQALAMTKLFKEIAVEDIGFQASSDVGFALYAEAGIFTFIKDEVQFNHQTYAEYFAAQFIFEFMTKDSRPENAKLEKICEQHILIEDKYRMFRAFLNGFLEKSQPRSIPSATESCKLNLVYCDEDGRNAYHVAAKEQTVGILKLISSHVVENDDGINSMIKYVRFRAGPSPYDRYPEYLLQKRADESPEITAKRMYGQRPLHVAASIPDNLAVVKFLVDNGADVRKNNQFERTALHVAACLPKNLAVLKFLVEHEADVTSKDNYKQTPLHYAIEKLNDLEIVEFLVKNGADVNAENDLKMTPLHHACRQSDNLEIIKFLVKEGANVNAKCHSGRTPLKNGADVNAENDLKMTPLHHACRQSDNLEIIKFLVKEGANVNAKCHNGRTPLHRVADDPHYLEIVKFLVENGAEVNAKDGLGLTPLHFAVLHSDNLQIMEFLVENGANVNAKDHNKWTPLRHACRQSDNLEIIKFLVKEGANVNAKCHNGRTPLHRVADDPHYLEIVKFLVENGAEVNAKDGLGLTPLHFAVLHSDNLQIMEFLVENGANVNAKDHNKWTPLRHACRQSDNLEIIKFLVKEGANVNAKCHNGRTPLHRVADDPHYLEIVKFLVENGAEVNAKDGLGLTPLHFAVLHSDNLQIMEFLVENGANVNAKDHNKWTPLRHACRQSDNLEIIKFLVKEGANVNAKCHNGRTPLHRVADDPHYLEIVKFLVENGAEVNAKDGLGFTPLHFAVFHSDNLQIMEFLVENGANVNAKNHDKTTPLHWVCWSSQSLKTVKFLFENGAEVNAEDISGRTPLYYAGVVSEIAKFLVEKGAVVTFEDKKR